LVRTFSNSYHLDLSVVGRLAPSALGQMLRLSLCTGGRLTWKAEGMEILPYGRSTTHPRPSTPTVPTTFSSVFDHMSWSLPTQLSPRRTPSPLLPSSHLAPRRSISKPLKTFEFPVLARSNCHVDRIKFHINHQVPRIQREILVGCRMVLEMRNTMVAPWRF
jgi:hypothetical protein